jgi:hypothetical protein
LFIKKVNAFGSWDDNGALVLTAAQDLLFAINLLFPAQYLLKWKKGGERFENTGRKEKMWPNRD